MIGRNDLCPCGSGKKYKKCCLSKDKKKTISARVVKNLSSNLSAMVMSAGKAYGEDMASALSKQIQAKKQAESE